MSTITRTFELGQVWQTPKGTLYKVIGFRPPTNKHKERAIFGEGLNGSGRLLYKDIDSISRWTLYRHYETI